ncbi:MULTISPECIES: 3-hydroxyacyl-CoA dehydrogenase NAD-binding domain-containing protein [unclassified Sphingomonas]|uniref:3-hydroxyacyl-CoA dehydrogenase NAD-binding domain-containing protein n=1 Tax=unclassified Sphingomonas TaxID=196159 RepID=UPI0006F6178A|nr:MULTISPECIES: 3-hydroxyacyl-CoA dehydrogenase NAD-binding domain-containing protein [unclassified Sphingomonas]KQX18682.1 3-hydroxyacyl-CoA dehydrogenase [Sphingomonas sp. Root1294]KQY71995.1 3-hydroxyacyl-CoA dehydrogenase [Sphingomonas sp. Root50]KRB94739.1 3-hydroxyacyl-CoA dehydrogenase [Sphingomonas sp. Root720]
MTIGTESIIAVVGAGTMGAGIALVAAQAGHSVRVIDTQEAALERGRQGIARSLASLVKRGTVDEAAAAAIADRIGWSTDVASAAPAALAVEAVVERMDVKTGLFRALAEHVAPDAILASNTSSLSIEAMAEGVPGPERFAGLHFFNPVPAMKLVELIASSRTAPGVIDTLEALMRSWKKLPVRVRDVPGFIVNRVARPYYGEGFAALGEGIDPALIDHALESAGGFRMGPLVLADLIGHDINYTVACQVFEGYAGKTRFRTHASQKAIYDSGQFGRKSGKGVYDYAADLPAPPFVAPGAVPGSIEAGPDAGEIEPLIALAEAAGGTVARSADIEPGALRIDGKLLAMGDGRRLADRADVDILLDAARDLAATPTLIVTTRDAEALALAAGFAKLVGKQLLALPDRPGQVVLRTLAQLANSGFDALADDIADAAGVDTAMRFGANHPQGPLDWARGFGTARLGSVLSNIAAATGDAIYAPSPAIGMSEPA